MTEKIEKLLNDVEKISNKYETIAQATGGNFNIFEIVNISHKEIYMCRLLSELLNPSGSHHQGNIYLKLFFETLSKNYCDKFNFKTPENAEVLKEEGIVGYRRIDISIDDEEHRQYLPIEVKIYAQDQKDQCKDYLTKKAKPKYNQGENARLCYLTIDGSLPDESSLGDMSDAERAQILAISWRKDIIEWLDACIMHKNTIEKAPIREVLIQFKKAVQKFTNQLEENEEMEIKDLILKSRDNLECAQKIYSTLFETQLEYWEKIKGKVKKEIDKHPVTDDDNWHLYYVTDNSTKIGLYFNCDATKNTGIDFYNIAGVVYTNNKIEDTYKEVNISTFICDDENFNEKIKAYVDWIIKQLKVNGQM